MPVAVLSQFPTGRLCYGWNPRFFQVMHQIHLPRVLLVQESIIKNQYPGGKTHLRLHIQPKCIVCRLKPLQQTGIRITRGLARTNQIGQFSFHRRRIHRSGDQKSMKPSAVIIGLLTADKSSQKEQNRQIHFSPTA